MEEQLLHCKVERDLWTFFFWLSLKFVNQDTGVISVRITGSQVWGGSPGHCRMFGEYPWSLSTRGTIPPPQSGQEKYFQVLLIVCWAQNTTSIDNCWVITTLGGYCKQHKKQTKTVRQCEGVKEELPRACFHLNACISRGFFLCRHMLTHTCNF
jgi:hypothetical protein